MKFFKHGGGRHLVCVRTVNSAVRSSYPENLTLEPNMKSIGSHVAEIWPCAYLEAYGTPIFRGDDLDRLMSCVVIGHVTIRSAVGGFL